MRAKLRHTKPSQLSLCVNTHGGARKGAGRKKTSTRVAHAKRDIVKSKFPLHITVRLRKGLPTLRSKRTFRLFRNAVLGAKSYGLNVLEFAVLGNHFHLLVESSGNEELQSAMKSLNIRLARSLNVMLKRSGAVVEDRFDLKILKTPTQVRNAMVYIFTNAAKHFRRRKVFDWYSSYASFQQSARLAKLRRDLDWRIPNVVDHFQDEFAELIDEARSWLGTVGWQRAA